jgi:hypothetical protein
MPKNDYTDPELTFPRLESEWQQIHAGDDACTVKIWLWERAGGPRKALLSTLEGYDPQAALQLVTDLATEYGAACSEDDITTKEPRGR